MPRHLLISALLTVPLAAGCGGTSVLTDGGPPDSGPFPGDAGSDAGLDGGLDAGPDGGPDAGVDAGPDAGPDAGADAGPDAGPDAGADAGTDAGSCPAGLTQNFPFTLPDQVSSIPSGVPITNGWHVPVGTVITYDMQPPVGGYHYPLWATWGTHTDVVPVSYLVHDEEHGGVILLYNCDGGCPDLVAQLQGIIDPQPQDSVCATEEPTINARFLLAPDPNLDVPFAALTWGWWYKQTDPCVNTEALKSFIGAHYEHGREDVCYQGSYQ